MSWAEFEKRHGPRPHPTSVLSQKWELLWTEWQAATEAAAKKAERHSDTCPGYWCECPEAIAAEIRGDGDE